MRFTEEKSFNSLACLYYINK